mgnify:CR=1 FL=1
MFCRWIRPFFGLAEIGVSRCPDISRLCNPATIEAMHRQGWSRNPQLDFSFWESG